MKYVKWRNFAVIKTQALWRDQQWVAVTRPDEGDITELMEKYSIPRTYISYISDVKERARFDYNFENQCGMFVFRTINHGNHSMKITHTKQTHPVYLMIKDNALITVNTSRHDLLNETMAELVSNDRIRQEEPSLLTLSLDALFELNRDYFDRINALDDTREELEGYKQRPSNDQIEKLSELSKSLIYFKAAARGNLIAVRQLQVMSDEDDDPINLNRVEQQRLKDLKTELEQSAEMAEINGEIVQQVADAYSNVLDNSLNNTMRILTIWSLALAVPPIISGFYGMNTKLPLFGGSWDWPLSILMSLIPVGLMVWYLRRNHDL